MAKCRGKTYNKNKSRVFALNLETYGKYTCEYCKKSPLYQNRLGETKMRHDLLTADHITPMFLNGTNGVKNLVTCCFECNLKKANNVA